MAGWRQAVELAMTDEEIAQLTSVSHSRTERASRVERARMLLAYRESPSFFAVARRLAAHHQTVQRCVERALAYGPLAALDDRPRPGKEPTITPEAKAWLVSLACDKAKDHGYPHELWTTRLLARHAREHRPAAGHECLADLVQGTVCKILGQEEIKPHKVRYYLERRDAEFEQKMAEVLCVYRRVQVLKRAAKSNKRHKPIAIVSYDEKPGIQAIATTAPDLPPQRGVYATFARDHEYKRHGTLSLLAGIDLLTGKVHARSKTATAAESSSNSSSFSIDVIRPALRSNSSSTIIPPTSRNRPELGSPLDQSAVLSSPSRPSMAPGSISSRASSQNSPAQSCATSGWHQSWSSRSASWLESTTSIGIPSSTRGPTSSPRPPDMIRTMETLT
jgi:transposase